MKYNYVVRADGKLLFVYEFEREAQEQANKIPGAEVCKIMSPEIYELEA